MSTSYKASGGETWSLVAMQTTGSDMDGDLVRRANPGIREPIQAGTLVNIPENISKKSEASGNPAIVVEGLQIETFDDFEMAMAIDAVSKASFVVPNEKETRDIFVPLYYPVTSICVGGKQLRIGRCGSRAADNSGETKTLSIPFFGLPAILEQSGPPIDAFPLEYKNQTLQQIASDLCWKHGIETAFDADTGGAFKRLDFQPGQSSLSFLADLAKQRSLIIADNEDGALVFRKGAKAGNPVGSYSKGAFPCVDMSMEIDDDKYCSSVTGYVSSRSRSDYKGQGFTIKNNYMIDVIKPHLERFESIEPGELQVAVECVAGRMFSDVVSVSAEFATWFDDNGDVFKPNTTIVLQSEEDGIPDPFEFLISSVTLFKKSDSMTASLNCVIPGVFSGEIPERMPWQK